MQGGIKFIFNQGQAFYIINIRDMYNVNQKRYIIFRGEDGQICY